ncbi:MAG: DUF4293 domain-containing protein [Rikenellaceae bacterium]|nr:DUF4293 domain-containing protein [Rikenellaceae bacterium]MCL2692561.1 DUF4293 domain-containing protein [Rikenellaceae bacterium]
MIQRIQTIYLLGAAVLMALALVLPLATFYGQGHEFMLRGTAIADTTDKTSPILMVATPWLATLLILAAVVPLAAIFLYKKRMVQTRLCFFEAVLLLGAQGFMAYYIIHYKAVIDAVSWKFGIATIFPAVAFVLVVLAVRAIIRDELLIKSLNRFR